MNINKIFQRNALYFILGVFALAIVIFVNNTSDIKGFFARTFETSSGIGIRYDQFVSPDANRKVTIVFQADGVSSNKKLNGFTVDIDGVPSSATNVEFELSDAVDNDLEWIHADNTNIDPMRITAVGTDSMDSNEDLFTLTFNVPGSFDSAILEVTGTLEIATNNATQAFADGAITVKKAIDAELDYETPQIDSDSGTVMVFIKNVDDIEFNGIDFEIDNIPDELDNVDADNSDTDIDSWTGAVNNDDEPVIASFVGTDSVGGDNDDVELFEISFDIDGNISSNDYLLLTAKIILDNNEEEILEPLRIYLNENGGGEYSDVGLIASDITIDDDQVDIILTATNLDSDMRINGLDFSIENFPSAFDNLAVQDDYINGADMVPASKSWTKAVNLSNVNTNNFVLTSVGTTSIGSSTITEADMYRLSFDLNGSNNLNTSIRLEGQFILNNDESQEFTPLIIDLSDDGNVGNADQNGNGFINAQDLPCIVAKWRVNDSTRTLRADINSDATVEVRDLAILLAKWQAGTALGPDTCIERK